MSFVTFRFVTQRRPAGGAYQYAAGEALFPPRKIPGRSLATTPEMRPAGSGSQPPAGGPQYPPKRRSAGGASLRAMIAAGGTRAQGALTLPPPDPV